MLVCLDTKDLVKQTERSQAKIDPRDCMSVLTQAKEALVQVGYTLNAIKYKLQNMKVTDLQEPYSYPMYTGTYTVRARYIGLDSFNLIVDQIDKVDLKVITASIDDAIRTAN
jgi:hypothetical protein